MSVGIFHGVSVRAVSSVTDWLALTIRTRSFPTLAKKLAEESLIWVVGTGLQAVAGTLRNYILVITAGTILRGLVSFQYCGVGEGELI